MQSFVRLFETLDESFENIFQLDIAPHFGDLGRFPTFDELVAKIEGIENEGFRLDSRRDLAELLTYLWGDSFQDAELMPLRPKLEKALSSIKGVEAINSVEPSQFNGQIHDCSVPLGPGRQVRVDVPGWQLRNDPRGVHTLRKATVSPW